MKSAGSRSSPWMGFSQSAWLPSMRSISVAMAAKTSERPVESDPLICPVELGSYVTNAYEPGFCQFLHAELPPNSIILSQINLHFY